ncbi:MAG: alpha/beta hydrolase [Acidimicrobiia bacterium]|nr:alpha/beta hydrolase [Acidimicrobiia bacterium]
MNIQQTQITANGLDVAYLECGEGPLALLLHGFPDSPRTWRHLMPKLAGAGFRAVAPWLRGYAPTGVDPEGRNQNGACVMDALALHDALGGESDAVIVGHDWGARIATGATVLEPERWRRIVTMAVPPAGAVAGAFFSYAQLRRSWYMFFFQHQLADVAVTMNDLEFIGHLWDDWSPGYDASAIDLPAAKDALRDPANLAAALGYYRATLSGTGLVPELQDAETACSGTPPQPHLYLHGRTDGCMGAEVAATAEAFLPSPGSRFLMIDGAGHFLHLEKPDEVDALVLEHVAR